VTDPAKPATSAKKTFDCPWCGAITPVQVSHMGEHFACPECKKATKLTASNTSDGPPTSAPPGAPHLSGDRTFDCPWCGAVSDVPSSHLGDRFHCPECAKETKLTATNTRVGVITAPPPDAPHVEASRGGRGLLVALLVVAAGVGAWFVFSGGHDQPAATGDGAAAATPTAAVPPASTTPPLPAAPMNDASPTPKDGATEQNADAVRARADVVTAAHELMAASAALDKAVAAVATWKQEHAGSEEAAAVVATLTEVRGEIARVAADRAAIPDPVHPTPEQARAARTALVAFLAASPGRTAIAERVHGWLRSDLDGREATSALDWRALDWRGSGVARSLAALSAAATSAAAVLPAELATAEAEARRTRDQAAERVATATAKAKALSEPR
jgi:transcription elongation factor Elf1